jgi:hypothetical protein
MYNNKCVRYCCIVFYHCFFGYKPEYFSENLYDSDYDSDNDSNNKRGCDYVNISDDKIYF